MVLKLTSFIAVAYNKFKYMHTISIMTFVAQIDFPHDISAGGQYLPTQHSQHLRRREMMDQLEGKWLHVLGIIQAFQVWFTGRLCDRLTHA